MTITPETRRKLRESWRKKGARRVRIEKAKEGQKKYYERRRKDKAENKKWLEEERNGKGSGLTRLLRRMHRERKESEEGGKDKDGIR